jgi:hypothetical protein
MFVMKGSRPSSPVLGRNKKALFSKSLRNVGYGTLFCLASLPAFANHSDTDGCPDIEINGGESLDVFISDYNTGEPLSDGAVVPPGTWIRFDSLATSYGMNRPGFRGGCLV